MIDVNRYAVFVSENNPVSRKLTTEMGCSICESRLIWKSKREALCSSCNWRISTGASKDKYFSQNIIIIVQR